MTKTFIFLVSITLLTKQGGQRQKSWDNKLLLQQWEKLEDVFSIMTAL